MELIKIIQLKLIHQNVKLLIIQIYLNNVKLHNILQYKHLDHY